MGFSLFYFPMFDRNLLSLVWIVWSMMVDLYYHCDYSLTINHIGLAFPLAFYTMTTSYGFLEIFILYRSA